MEWRSIIDIRARRCRLVTEYWGLLRAKRRSANTVRDEVGASFVSINI